MSQQFFLIYQPAKKCFATLIFTPWSACDTILVGYESKKICLHNQEMGFAYISGLSLHKINQEMGSCDIASNNGDKTSERLSFMSDVWNT